jgi:hypothetical protein
LPAGQTDTAPQAALREKNAKEGLPEFCSDYFAHFSQKIDMHIDKCLVLQRVIFSFIKTDMLFVCIVDRERSETSKARCGQVLRM